MQKQNKIATYWYEAGSQIRVTTEPDDHGKLIGTLHLTPAEFREVYMAAWQSRALTVDEVEARLPSARWLRVGRANA